jgi:hypothetical protein
MPPGGEFFAAFGKRVASRTIKGLATCRVGAVARANPILPQDGRLGLALAPVTIGIGGTIDCAPNWARMGASGGQGAP